VSQEHSTLGHEQSSEWETTDAVDDAWETVEMHMAVLAADMADSSTPVLLAESRKKLARSLVSDRISLTQRTQDEASCSAKFSTWFLQ